MSFTKLNPTDFVISADSISSTLFTGNNPGLSTFFTSSTQAVNTAYFYDVYNADPTTSGSNVQFSIAYGNILGSGSLAINNSIPQNSRSRIIYGQFRNLIYGDENTLFNFGTGNSASMDIYVISVDRARYKEKLFTGTFNLYLSGSNEIQLTDNSKNITTVTYCDAGRIYDIVSGSNSSATTTAIGQGITSGYTPSGSYGKFLPDVGLIILNPRALALPAISGGIAMTITTASNAASNNRTNLFSAISSSGAIRPSGSFFLNSEETITSDYLFIRINNADYNYTTNPSMISGSGDFIYSSFINNPQTYPTTVGLYNDNNDLLAVAKFSRPLTKDFTKEGLVRVKLDF
jgi:hypothetical protein